MAKLQRAIEELKERDRDLWSLMATNMDADKPMEYCKRLRAINME